MVVEANKAHIHEGRTDTYSGRLKRGAQRGESALRHEQKAEPVTDVSERSELSTTLSEGATTLCRYRTLDV